jgi:hypothetical protein
MSDLVPLVRRYERLGNGSIPFGNRSLPLLSRSLLFANRRVPGPTPTLVQHPVWLSIPPMWHGRGILKSDLLGGMEGTGAQALKLSVGLGLVLAQELF